MSGSLGRQGRDLARQARQSRKRALRTRKRETRQRYKKMHTVFAILCGLAFLAVIAVGYSLLPKREAADGEDQAVPVTQDWYEGGTLHRAPVRTWLASPYRDRLATSADLLALNMQLAGWPHLRSDPESERFRKMAEALEKMIPEVGTGNKTVEEVAAECWVGLEQEWR